MNYFSVQLSSMMKFSVVLAIFAALAMHAIFADETIYVSVTPAPSSETTTEMATTKTESSSMIGTLYFFLCKWQWST